VFNKRKVDNGGQIYQEGDSGSRHKILFVFCCFYSAGIMLIPAPKVVRPKQYLVTSKNPHDQLRFHNK
jgi:hypothetical protein